MSVFRTISIIDGSKIGAIADGQEFGRSRDRDVLFQLIRGQGGQGDDQVSQFDLRLLEGGEIGLFKEEKTTITAPLRVGIDTNPRGGV